MNPVSLSILRKVPSITKIVEEAEKFSEENKLVPLLTFYLEDELLNNLVKTLDNKFSNTFKEYGYDKTVFIKKLYNN
ncbi:hypothetical protein [Acidianus manzaensis]|uniref:Uncharacterized protein n=1 Tax=Acidianus manzaensis TaxID=282676 RepID=A0A1W6JXE2_9CREN|nr:hypothetical protein [Acidianus manzaensis]ARM74933.1 hypothetical protein B6F84_02085 [Acidianus manzaensis]